jgi:O-methyltransferase involved in polyketide biosynthesis
MLWALHSRVSQAIRDDGILQNPEAIGTYETLDYDYNKTFGRAEPTSVVRSAMFDAELSRFLNAHLNGVIVNLA